MTKLVNIESATRWLYIRGPREAALQIRLIAGPACIPSEGHSAFMAEHTHCFQFEDGIPDPVIELVELLKEVLTLTRSANLTCALALDWYKRPDPSIDSWNWPNTDSGDLVHRGKYWNENVPARNAARKELLDRVVAVIERHALYEQADYIVTVPGHKADGRSFAEGLARKVAELTGKNLVETKSTVGERSPSKEGGVQNLRNAFALPVNLDGDAIIIDDVLRSGQTMSAVAAAAKRAGANRTLGLAAVRTLRN